VPSKQPTVSLVATPIASMSTVIAITRLSVAAGAATATSTVSASMIPTATAVPRPRPTPRPADGVSAVGADDPDRR